MAEGLEKLKIEEILEKYKERRSFSTVIFLIEKLDKLKEIGDDGSYSNYVDGLEAELKNLVEIKKISKSEAKTIAKLYGCIVE